MIGLNRSEVEAPDLIEKVIAYREWSLDSNGVLGAPYRDGFFWSPKENIAVCDSGTGFVQFIDNLTTDPELCERIVRDIGFDHKKAKMYKDASTYFRSELGYTLYTQPALKKKLLGWLRESGAHKSPSAFCSCGFYGWFDKQREFVYKALISDPYVVRGIATFWGRCCVHDSGIRTEFAQPVVLGCEPNWSSSNIERVMKAADRYGAIVVPHEGLWQAAVEFGAPMPKELLPDQSLPQMLQQPSWYVHFSMPTPQPRSLALQSYPLRMKQVKIRQRKSYLARQKLTTQDKIDDRLTERLRAKGIVTEQLTPAKVKQSFWKRLFKK